MDALIESAPPETQELIKLAEKKEPLQAQQREVLQKREAFRVKLDRATGELAEARRAYDQECINAANEVKGADPGKHLTKINHTEATMKGLTKIIEEQSAISSDLDRQIGEIQAAMNGHAYHLELRRLQAECEVADQKVKDAWQGWQDAQVAASAIHREFAEHSTRVVVHGQ
jgi:hypothetical protein